MVQLGLGGSNDPTLSRQHNKPNGLEQQAPYLGKAGNNDSQGMGIVPDQVQPFPFLIPTTIPSLEKSL